MRLTAAFGLIIMAGLLAGCLRLGAHHLMGPVDEMLPRQPDHCGLASLQNLRGEKMERLADYRLPGPLRVLWPGQEITNDINPSRLNVEVDVKGRIWRMMCG